MKIWDFAWGRSRRVAREAANWRAEMEEPSSVAQIAVFEAWLKADPAHFRAYHQSNRVAEVGARLSPAQPSINVPISGGYRPAYAVAATLVVVCGTWWLLREPAPAYAAIVNRGPATRVVALRDGSVVALDTATKLEIAVNPAARHVRVLSGRARFAVRLTSKGMLKVTALVGEVTSASGVFDVAVAQDDVRVWVISGNARVAASGANRNITRLTLQSGRGAQLRGGVATAVQGERPDLTWPQAHVAFDDAPLATILRSANRSGMPPILVGDEAIGRLTVTGVLDLRDTRRLARKLAAALDLKAVERGEAILLTR